MNKSKVFVNHYLLNPIVFEVLMIFALFFMQIPFIHSAYGKYIKVLLIFGLAICFYDLMFRDGKKRFNDKIFLSLFLFAFCYGITIVTNHNLCFSSNVNQLIYMLVFFWVLFMIPINTQKELIEKNALIVSYVIVIVSFALSVASLLMYILNISEWYYSLDGESCCYLGIVDGKLCGLYNSNSCGEIAGVSIISSVFAFLNDINETFMKRIRKVFLVFNCVVQYVVLLLSQSRGSFYSLLFVMALMLTIVIVKSMNNKATIKGILFVVLLVSILIGVELFSKGVYKIVRDNLIMVSYEDSVSVEKDTMFENLIESELLKYFESPSALSGNINLGIGNGATNGDSLSSVITTGRSSIWKAGFAVFLKNPVFGVSREGLIYKTNEVLGFESGSVYGGGLHSIYLTVLVSSGIIGTFFIGFAIVSVLFKSAKVLLMSKEIDKYILISLAMVLYFLISEMVENRILYQVTVFNIVFWIYAGYLYYFTRKELKEERNEFSFIKTE